MKSGFSLAAALSFALALIFCANASAQATADTTVTAPVVQAPIVPATVQASTPTSIPAASAADDSQAGNPALSIRSDRAAAESEPAANEEYTLGAGDQITLDFPGRTELAGTHTIGPDGRITLPLAGPLHIAGLSREAAGKAIVDSLATFYSDLSVTVRIDKYTSNRVRVLGYVQHPGEIYFEDTPTLLDAISKAGLISPTVAKEGRTVAVGSGIPETCTIFRGDHTTYQVQLRSLLMSGNVLADMRLHRNDIIFVPEPQEQFVSVLGEVTRPGTIPLTPASTLTSILSEAGCCSEGGGFSPKVHIIQPSTGKEFDVSYKKLMTVAGQKEYTLHSGDVILIPKSGFFKSTYVFQRISPVTSLIGLAAIGVL